MDAAIPLTGAIPDFTSAAIHVTGAIPDFTSAAIHVTGALSDFTSAAIPVTGALSDFTSAAILLRVLYPMHVQNHSFNSFSSRHTRSTCAPVSVT